MIMKILKNYKKALGLWVILYIVASITGAGLWFFVSSPTANTVMVIFTPLVIFVFANIYFGKEKTDLSKWEGLFLAVLWMVMGIVSDIIFYIIIARYMTLEQYFIDQQPYMLLWNIAALGAGYFAGKK
jgi:hypothetical protein